MEYRFYITRSTRWESDHRHDIPYADWQRVVECDPELEVDLESRTTVAERWRWEQEESSDDPEVLAICRPEDEDDPSICLEYVDWTGHPSAAEDPSFCFYDGTIDTLNPDGPTLRKMILLAEALGGTVHGPQGEIYRLTLRGIEYCALSPSKRTLRKMLRIAKELRGTLHSQPVGETPRLPVPGIEFPQGAPYWRLLQER